MEKIRIELSNQKVKKGELRRQHLIDSAAFCLAQYGIKGTTFQKIVSHSGASAGLVVHYFKSSRNIFSMVVAERMKRVQERSGAVIAMAGSPETKLKAYFELSFQLYRESPENAKLYLMLFNQSGFEEKERELSTSLRKVAVDRIAAIVQQGVRSGDFKVANVTMAAKIIHNALNGCLLSQITENNPPSDKLVMKSLLEFSLRFLQGGLNN